MIFDNMGHYSYNLNTDRLISMIEGSKAREKTENRISCSRETGPWE